VGDAHDRHAVFPTPVLQFTERREGGPALAASGRPELQHVDPAGLEPADGLAPHPVGNVDGGGVIAEAQ
jgi:hypothetical protein